MMDARQIASYIDHTILKPDAVIGDIEKLCQEAVQHQFYSVCVNSMWVNDCRRILEGTSVKISAVCGFPLGANASEVKAYEAAYSVEKGAAEIDMVLPIGALLTGDERTVYEDIRKVTQMVRGSAIVKVILETGFLTEQQIERASLLSEEAGAHYVKTSTGFGPRGASLEDIAVMKRVISDQMRIKASGGIRDLHTAQQMIAAGADRLGTSSGTAIVSSG